MNFNDVIQGQKFWGICKYVFSPNINNVDYNRQPNTFNLSLLKDGDTIYTHTMYAKALNEILAQTQKKVVVVSHNADEALDFIPQPNVIKWFSQNVNIVCDRVESIPIGIQNDRWFVSVNKIEKMKEVFYRQYSRWKTIYANHNIRTNPKERKSAYAYAELLKTATIKSGKHPWNDLEEYLIDLAEHKFVVSPEGNGIDCHRTWEALYMGCLPILKRSINSSFYTSLPTVLIDEWSDLTEDLLIDEEKRIRESSFNYDLLTFAYWKNRIYDSI